MTISYAPEPQRAAGQAPTDGSPLIVNFGGGVDSTAMLIGMQQRGIRPDLIIFADTGAERPETITWVESFSEWLQARGFPAVTVVRRYGEEDEGGVYGLRSRASKTGDGYTTLEGNCLQNETPPSEALGNGSCSSKWKQEPMDTWLSRHPDIQAARELGMVPTKAIGLDCGPADLRRKVMADEDGNPLVRITARQSAWPSIERPNSNGRPERFVRGWYPLREWGWTRDDCLRVIREAGLVPPVKSSCFFCPNMMESELEQLQAEHPDLLQRAIAVEDAARLGRHGLRTIEGLWRRSRKRDGRPGSWRVWAESKGYVSPDPSVHEHVARVQAGQLAKREAAKAARRAAKAAAA